MSAQSLRVVFCTLSAGSLGLVLLMGTAGCQHKTEEPRTPAAATAGPPSVTVVRPVRKTVKRTITQPGQIEAFEQAPLYVKIPGYIKAVHKDIGDRVRKGDLLAELWVPEMVE